MSEHVVDTCVGRLRVHVLPEGSQAATAVLWHSLFVDERTWGRVLPDLAQDRQLVVVTGPGHGRSEDPGQRYNMQDCADAAYLGPLEAPTEFIRLVREFWAAHPPQDDRTLQE